jgi:hypothetical protein
MHPILKPSDFEGGKSYDKSFTPKNSSAYLWVRMVFDIPPAKNTFAQNPDP